MDDSDDNHGTGPEAESQRLSWLLIDTFRGGLAATIAGVICAGVGARLVMRISGAINPEAAGARTENGNIVGEITFGGTLELLIFNGVLIGFLMGTMWVGAREWLPRQPALRVSLAGLLATLVGGSLVVDSANVDFIIVEPAWLHVVMFTVLVALAGALTAALDLALEGRIPVGETSSAVLGGLSALGAMFGAPFLVVYFFVPGGGQNGTPPWLAGLAFAGLMVATVAGWARFYRKGEAAAELRPGWERALGYGGVVLFGLFGGIHLAGEMNGIL